MPGVVFEANRGQIGSARFPGREKVGDAAPHDLRDTATTLAFGAGASVPEVMGMLGYSTIVVTDRYSHLSDSITGV